MVTQKWKNTGMRIAVNGVWGNLGVASAALITGYLIDNGGWRLAFIVPGVVSIAIGIAYIVARWPEFVSEKSAPKATAQAVAASYSPDYRALLLRVSVIVFITAAISSIIFQATTFALPKIFDERLHGIAKTMVGFAESIGLGGRADIATMVGAFAFIVFAVASVAQLIVGSLLDRFGARPVFMGAAAVQLVFFLAMPGLVDALALAVALGFMLGAFGQIPINDYMIGKLAAGEFRARVYGVRYVVSFTALAASLPLIAFVYEGWGFDTLFRVLAATALAILVTVACLPRRLPAPEPAPAPAE
jgi:MFS family permease